MTYILTALAIGVALIIVAFLAGVAYLVWYTAVQSTKQSNGTTGSERINKK